MSFDRSLLVIVTTMMNNDDVVFVSLACLLDASLSTTSFVGDGFCPLKTYVNDYLFLFAL